MVKETKPRANLLQNKRPVFGGDEPRRTSAAGVEATHRRVLGHVRHAKVEKLSGVACQTGDSSRLKIIENMDNIKAIEQIASVRLFFLAIQTRPVIS